MKRSKIILTTVLAILMISIVFLKLFNDESITAGNSESLKFKEEYESFNDVEGYISLDISSNNPMVYATYDEVEKIITSGTGVIYFGFPKCPWCRNVVPQLISSAADVGLDKIYYFNALEIRDIKKLDQNGNVLVEKEGTAEYKKLVELLYDYIDVYEGLNDETIKRLYFPTVVFVKDGKILGSHIGTVDSQNDPNVPLTESQVSELKEIYTEYMLKVLGTVCDTDKQNKC